MKTKSHWISTYPLNRYDLRNVIEQIQLDAMREGMRRAADKIQTREDLRQAILSTAELLTEKDLE